MVNMEYLDRILGDSVKQFLRMMHQRDRVNVQAISTSGARYGHRSMRFTIVSMSFSTSREMFG